MTSTRYLLATGADGPPDRGRPRTVVVPGVSQGGPEDLCPALVEHLIVAERAGVHTVILAGAVADLDSDPAKVCRYVATDEPDVIQLAAGRYGAERVLHVPSAAIDDIADWITELPRPQALTARRRIRRAARQFPAVRWLYSRIRSGG